MQLADETKLSLSIYPARIHRARVEIEYLLPDTAGFIAKTYSLPYEDRILFYNQDKNTICFLEKEFNQHFYHAELRNGTYFSIFLCLDTE